MNVVSVFALRGHAYMRAAAPGRMHMFARTTSNASLSDGSVEFDADSDSMSGSDRSDPDSDGEQTPPDAAPPAAFARFNAAHVDTSLAVHTRVPHAGIALAKFRPSVSVSHAEVKRARRKYVYSRDTATRDVMEAFVYTTLAQRMLADGAGVQRFADMPRRGGALATIGGGGTDDADVNDVVVVFREIMDAQTSSCGEADDLLRVVTRNYLTVRDTDDTIEPRGYCLLPHIVTTAALLSCAPNTELFAYRRAPNDDLITLYSLGPIEKGAPLSLALWDTYASVPERADARLARTGRIECACDRCTDGERGFDDHCRSTLRCAECAGALIPPAMVVVDMDAAADVATAAPHTDHAWRCIECDDAVHAGYVSAVLAAHTMLYEAAYAASRSGATTNAIAILCDLIDEMELTLAANHVLLFRTYALFASEVLRHAQHTHSYALIARGLAAACRAIVVGASGDAVLAPWCSDMRALYCSARRLASIGQRLHSGPAGDAERRAYFERIAAEMARAEHAILSVVDPDRIAATPDDAPPHLLDHASALSIAARIATLCGDTA